MTMTTRRTITLTELASKLEARTPLVLLEALPEHHYQKEHLPTARNLPHDQVERLAAALIPAKTTEVVVYCASATCRNSDTAATALARLGYGDVRVFSGGKQEWAAAGLPFEA